MEILFLDSPMLPMREWLEDNNCNINKPGYEHPNKVEALYVHNTLFDYRTYPRLKYILCPMTGVNHIRYDPSKQELIYLKDKEWLYYNVWSTAEHTLYTISRLMRGLNREIRGKTIGIIGFGRVGQQMYKLLSGYDVNIIWYDTRTYLYELSEAPGKVDNLNDIYKNSEIILLHLPETSLTKHYINHKQFEIMEKQPIIVNTSRESIVNNAALMAAFEKGLISGFGLDIDLNNEDITSKKILDLCKVYKGAVYTPHIAGKSIESRCITDKWVFNTLFERLGGTSFDKYNFGFLQQSSREYTDNRGND